MKDVCDSCVLWVYQETRGSLDYDECVEGLKHIGESEGWKHEDNRHICFTNIYDTGKTEPWVAHCNCSGLHHKSNKDFWDKVGLA